MFLFVCESLAPKIPSHLNFFNHLNFFVHFRGFNFCHHISEYCSSVGLQTRTTKFSCDGDENYHDFPLIHQALPWVVRVMFGSEDSERETLCSGNKLGVEF